MAQLAGLDRGKVGALFRLRGRLTLRQFSREPGKIVGAVLVILLLAPMVLGAAVASAIGYLRLPDHWPAELLGIILVSLWVIWLIFPVIFSSINEGMDMTRLLIYPIQRRDLVVSVLLGTLFDYPTYLMLPLFAAIFIGWGWSIILPVVVVAVLLSYAHMVLISQLVMTAVGGILQSRRFRDVAIIVASLLGSSCYFLQLSFQRLTENMSEMVSREELLALSPMATLQWLPTGATARSIQQASEGAWGSALLWLVYSTILLLLVAWVWWRLLIRLTTGEGFLLSWPTKPAVKPTAIRIDNHSRSRRWIDGFVPAWLPADIGQLALKELKSVWRIPQRRVGMLQGILMPFIMVGAFILSGEFSSFTLPPWIGALLPIYALFIFWATTQNMLAWEGHGLSTLLLTPVPRRRIFLAKGLALMLVAGLPFLIIGLVLIVMTRGWQSVAGTLTGLSMGIATIAVMSVSSVIFPIPINLESQKMRSSFSSGGSCLAGLAITFIVPVFLGLVSLPAALPLALGYWLDQPILAFVGLPVSLLYAATVFWLGARWAGTLLLQREAEVLAALRRPQQGE